MRLTVFRSNKYIYAQAIDDAKRVTVAEAHGKNPSEVGKLVAQRAVKAGVKKIAFDRGRYRYHGQIKVLADGAREGGLAF